MNKKVTYYTEGSVRGRCGHKHYTVEGAIACLETDQRYCKRVGGYSDRGLYRSDGEWIGTELTDAGDLVVSQETWETLPPFEGTS